MALHEEDAHAGFLLGGGGGEAKVDGVSEERVRLAAAEECLAGGGVVAVVAGEVEFGCCEADGVGVVGRRDGVVLRDGETPVEEV